MSLFVISRIRPQATLSQRMSREMAAPSTGSTASWTRTARRELCTTRRTISKGLEQPSIKGTSGTSAIGLRLG